MNQNKQLGITIFFIASAILLYGCGREETQRPDHPEEGTYSRKKEMRCYYDGQYGYIYNNCYRNNG